MAPTDLCLKSNNCITNDPCALCGARCDPTGFDLFVAGTWALVCDTCGDYYTPELQRIRLENLSPESAA